MTMPWTTRAASDARTLQFGPSHRRFLGTIMSALLMWLLSMPLAVAAAKNSYDGSGKDSAANRQGYSSRDVFLSIDGTDVNAFNFNYSIAFSNKVGLSYPQNAGISLDPVRYYNSRVWWWEHMACNNKTFFRIRRENPMGLGFDFHFGRIVPVHQIEETTARKDQWVWAYVSPDGATHKLVPGAESCGPPSYCACTVGTQYPTETDPRSIDANPDGAAPPSQTTVYYSHDGSHLKAVRNIQGSMTTGWTLYFPDGTVRELTHEVRGPVKEDLIPQNLHICNSDWDLEGSHNLRADSTLDPEARDRDWVGWYTTRVRTQADTSGNPAASYTITYNSLLADRNGDGIAVAVFPYIPATVTDQFGRTMTVTVETNASSPNFGLITEIQTPGPGDVSGNPRMQTYRFFYQDWTIPVPGFSNLVVKVLTKVEQPALVGGQVHAHHYEYTGLQNCPGTYACEIEDFNHGGQIETIRYPSGRVERFTYGEYPFFLTDGDLCNCPRWGSAQYRRSWGVSKKEVFLDGNVNNTGSSNRRMWEFDQVETEAHVDTVMGCADEVGHWCGFCSGNYCNQVQEFDQINIMHDANGNSIAMTFRTPYKKPEQPLYGLLVKEVHYKGRRAPQYQPSTPVVKVVDYTYTKEDDDCFYGVEQLQSRIETVYYDDMVNGTATRVVEQRSSPDGFGHYERSVFSGNGVGDARKIVVTDYASNDTNGSGTPCTYATQARDHWLGNMVLREEVLWDIDPQITTIAEVPLRRTEYGFDPFTGRRTKKIARSVPAVPADVCLSEPVAREGDVCETYQYWTSGDLKTKQAWIQGASGPGPAYTWDYGYEYGVQASQKNAGLSYFDSLKTIDFGSGLVREARTNVTGLSDPRAVVQKVEYDILGRTTKITDGTDAPLNIVYQNEPLECCSGSCGGSSGVCDVRLDRITSAQGTGTDSLQSTEYFDRLGRTTKVETVHGDGRPPSYVHTVYDDRGRVWKASVPSTNSTYTDAIPHTETTYISPGTCNPAPCPDDPSDRATRIETPEGRVTLTEYFGTNQRTTQVGVLGLVGSAGPDRSMNVTTTTYADGLGRLRAVDVDTAGSLTNDSDGTDQSGEPAADAVYHYAVTGELEEVNLVASLSLEPTVTDRYHSANALEQTRSMAYDGLGRLTDETHPENGTTTNLAFDALGQIVAWQDARGAAGGYRFENTYDSAGRLTKVEMVRTEAGSDVIKYYNFDANLSGWQNPDATPSQSRWHRIAAGAQGCPSGSTYNGSAGALRYGNTTNCTYDAAWEGTAEVIETNETITAGPEAFVHFMYRRLVRKVSTTPPTLLSAKDATWLEIRDLDAGLTRRVFYRDATDDSWDAWRSSGRIRLGDYFDFPGGAAHSIRLSFHFSKGDSDSVGTSRGWFIDDVLLASPQRTTLQTLTYDEDHCPVSQMGWCHALSGSEPSRFRGKVTTESSFGWGTTLAGGAVAGVPFATKRHVYKASNGRVSSTQTSIDWRGTGVPEVFYDQRDYNSLGAMTKHGLPQRTGTSGRIYEFEIEHGLLRAVTDDTQRSYVSSIEYDEADAIGEFTYANGVTGSFSYDDEHRIEAIHTQGAAGVFNPGSYAYDGAGNITAIGPNQYRYDAAGRLIRTTQQRKNTSDSESQYILRTHYDRYGNMTSSVRQDANTLPTVNGLAFTGRTYASNRISNSGFSYDPNGNLINEPQHDEMSGAIYRFSALNRLGSLWATGETYPTADYGYDGAGARVFKELTGVGGNGEITLFVRDGPGHVLSEFRPTPLGATGFVKDYIYMGSQLVAENANCYSPPYLGIDSPWRSGDQVRFIKEDTVEPPAGTHVFMRVFAGPGYERVIDVGVAPLGDPIAGSDPPQERFSRPLTDFFAGRTNIITIGGQLDCGSTGYSNELALTLPPGQPDPPADCVTSMIIARGGASQVSVDGGILIDWETNCPPGTEYTILYHEPKAPLSSDVFVTSSFEPRVAIFDQSAIEELSTYRVRAEVSGLNPPPTVSADIDGGSAHPHMLDGGGGDPEMPPVTAPPPAVTTQFSHWDHLGSTRAITDEAGAFVARMDFFPFGQEVPDVDAVGTTATHKFTGHERDAESALDYMMARYYSPNLSRFVATDRKGFHQLDRAGKQSYQALPQRWNRYTYALDNPLEYTDPDGLDVVNKATDSTTRQFVQDARRFSGAVKALDKDRNTIVNVWNGPTAKLKDGDQGGATQFVHDSNTGKTIVNVVIDSNQLKTSAKIEDMTATELGRAVQIQSDPVGMAKEANASGSKHPVVAEAQKVGDRIEADVAAGRKSDQEKAEAKQQEKKQP